MISAIDHFQLAMPVGGEVRARAFFCSVLGMREVEKSPGLAKRGGAWFASGAVQLHLGVEADFRPAKKAHPAFVTANGKELRVRLAAAGYPVRDDDAIDNVRRFFTDDCFGNRLEFIEVAAGSAA